MKYNLTTERYETSTLQAELTTAGLTAHINGHGDKCFNVICDDEAAADVVVQAHLAKTNAEHDASIDDADKDRKVDFSNVDPFLKAYVLAVNDGSIVPGSNMTPLQLKTEIRKKL